MSVDIAEIRRVVVEAGELALLYSGKVARSLKADLSVVSEADEAVESFLRLALTSLAPGYGYIGEETEDSRPPESGETHAWVVDALDGSRAFVAGLPLWTPAVCLLDGVRPVAGAALNPVTRELFWAGPDGPARVNDEPLHPAYPTELEPNTCILGPTNYHRRFDVDFPGRIYCLGAPIYQLCLVAKGPVGPRAPRAPAREDRSRAGLCLRTTGRSRRARRSRHGPGADLRRRAGAGLDPPRAHHVPGRMRPDGRHEPWTARTAPTISPTVA